MEFTILGPLEVKSGGRAIPIHGRLCKALLAILLLNHGRAVTVTSLIDGMWPDEPPRSAVENIRSYVSQIRCALRTLGEPERIESLQGGYRLEAEESELDLLRFLALAEAGRKCLKGGGDPAYAVSVLSQARALCLDEPLCGIEFGMGVAAKLGALRERLRQVDIDLVEAQFLLADHVGLLPTLRQLTAQYPLDEGLWCRLIIVLHAMGRSAEALSTFAEVRRVLVNDLGIEPGPDLQRIQQAVLGGAGWESLAVSAVGH